MDGFTKIKNYLNDLELTTSEEIPEEGIFIVQDEENGILNLLIDVEEPIVILEQFIIEVPAQGNERCYRRLLQMNRNLVHGAFVIDEQATRVYFRDTLQLANLDRNELEGSIKALSLALAEMGNELLELAH